MNQPYEDVNWDSVIRVSSATHMHLTSQEHLENGYRYGIRHFPISNYYPSAPYNAETRLSDFRLRQWWPAKRDGVPVEPPINWNEIITWPEELEEPYRSSLPFTETEPVYSAIPDDVIISPNAEHHGFTNSSCHICSPGSSFISGTFDARSHYHLNQHGFPVGFGGSWEEGFEGMIDGLVYADGGGITINHPTWFSRFSLDEVCAMLDFDDRVLGIEIYSDYSANRDWFANPDFEPPETESEVGFSTGLWDKILATGRRCLGFCVPDHNVCKGGDWHGRSVLLIASFTEHDCLKAHRDGNFYGCLKDNGLSVTGFRASESEIAVTTNTEATIRFITEQGVASSATGTQAVYSVPQKDGRPAVVFARVEISDETGERLFLQPVMFG